MGPAIHPDGTGVPHRIGLLERLLVARDGAPIMRGDWYLGTGDDA